MGVVFQNCVRLPTAGRLCARDREMEGGGCTYILPWSSKKSEKRLSGLRPSTSPAPEVLPGWARGRWSSICTRRPGSSSGKWQCGGAAWTSLWCRARGCGPGSAWRSWGIDGGARIMRGVTIGDRGFPAWPSHWLGTLPLTRRGSTGIFTRPARKRGQAFSFARGGSFPACAFRHASSLPCFTSNRWPQKPHQ